MGKKVYSWSTVVSIKETDLSGNVYYLNYMDWCAKARELFAIENFERFATSYSFIVRSVEHSFIACASFQDKIVIEIQIDEITITSATMVLHIFKIDRHGKTLIGAQTQKLVAVDVQRGRPIRMPEEVIRIINEYHVPSQERDIPFRAGGVRRVESLTDLC